MMALASGFCASPDSVTWPPSYTPATPPSPPSQYGLMLMPMGAPHFIGLGVGGRTYGSSLDYSPWSPVPRPGSPDDSPSEPSAASPYYAPSTPLSRASLPDYTPGTPSSSLLPCDAEWRMSPDYTPTPSHLVSDAQSRISPDYTLSSPLLPYDAEWRMSTDYTPTPSHLVSDAESRMSPDYTPSTPTSRAASPDYTPSTPPLSTSPQVADTSASTCSPRANRISRGRHQRALGF